MELYTMMSAKVDNSFKNLAYKGQRYIAFGPILAGIGEE